LKRSKITKGRACTQVPLRTAAELGFFQFLEIVTGWLVRRLANFFFYKSEKLQEVNTENYENSEFETKRKKRKKKRERKEKKN
jgi:hypothetical protein